MSIFLVWDVQQSAGEEPDAGEEPATGEVPGTGKETNSEDKKDSNEKQSNVEKQIAKQEDEKEEELPNTSTNMFNMFMFGFVLMLLGTTAFFLAQKRKKA
ncbi:LPXTG cell wall anchor domain-containing protein [Metabacillus bambusae]|uniref:LPXTG cell wall anchor domain-containing protein n=1 Tax=Metabacillus bambusae TaxID=2795218 RepID=A0ABS3N0Y8_9BACI|nr:LPXTG cell wall anchor domain-containing protein [Metabacillus bambusae]MBO1511779.1 LPXTG cell wall anchor domain-containing protein [Metabacillus bambusae]